jgi:hypothetical protein
MNVSLGSDSDHEALGGVILLLRWQIRVRLGWTIEQTLEFGHGWKTTTMSSCVVTPQRIRLVISCITLRIHLVVFMHHAAHLPRRLHTSRRAFAPCITPCIPHRPLHRRWPGLAMRWSNKKIGDLLTVGLPHVMVAVVVITVVVVPFVAVVPLVEPLVICHDTELAPALEKMGC